MHMLYLRMQWNSDSLVFSTVHIEEMPVGKDPWTCLSNAITKYNAEEVQALCYLKFLQHCKQKELFKGNCLGYYVDFSGDMNQLDLCHVE